MQHSVVENSDSTRASKRRVTAGLGLILVGLGAALVWLTVPQSTVTSVPVEARRAPNQAASELFQSFADATGRRTTTPNLQAVPLASAERQPVSKSGLAQLERTKAQNELIWKAEQLAVAQCMRDRGFSYTPIPFDDTDDLEFEVERPEPDDVEAASEQGYGIARGIDANARPEPTEDLPEQFKRMSPEQREKFHTALLGPRVSPRQETPDAGWESLTLPNGAKVTWYKNSCYSVARRRVHGDNYARRDLSDTHQELKSEVDEQLETDPAYRSGIQRWRECMKARGFDYDAPGAAAAELGAAYGEGKLSLSDLRERETRVASADAACYGEVGLREIAARARALGEARVLERSSDKVAEAKREQEEELTRAQTLVSNVDSDEG